MSPVVSLTSVPVPSPVSGPSVACRPSVGYEAWLEAVTGLPGTRPSSGMLVGVLPGEGIGPQVTTIALQVLEAVSEVTGNRFSIETGGKIGCDAEAVSGCPLPDEVTAFCQSVFDRGGAILNGPGGSRYVYDLRKAFDLFFKISPIQASLGLCESSPVKMEVLKDLDLLVVRENISGLYQGEPGLTTTAAGQQRSHHAFSYREEDVRRFLSAAARLASMRRGDLVVVYKQYGVPTISALWKQCATDAALAAGIGLRMVDVDLMAYQLVTQPSQFDVVAAPNMCGDILADLAAALLGSRAMSFSGNYTPLGCGVYQTNHGAAYDLAGADTASPVGQILSLAMMLRHSFGLDIEAYAIEEGLRQVWQDGWRTNEVASPGSRLAGTRKMGELVAQAAARAARQFTALP